MINRDGRRVSSMDNEGKEEKHFPFVKIKIKKGIQIN
jgi:hypothetical protein